MAITFPLHGKGREFESRCGQLDDMAEWSKAPGLGPGLSGGVGSNPTIIILSKKE